MEFLTKDELLSHLRSLPYIPDDDDIRIKERIKEELLKCPELLYAIHNPELESELFNEDGTINEDGEWDRYFGATSNIRPYLYFPDVQTDSMNFVCYQVHFDELPSYSRREKAVQKYCQITFICLCYHKDSMDKTTGIPRHDLLASIIRSRFNWTNLFGNQFHLISDKENATDNNYTVRTMIFQGILTNNILQTEDGTSRVINNVVRK